MSNQYFIFLLKHIKTQFSLKKIKNAIKEFSDEVMKVVQVIDTDEVEVVREMSIEDFIEHSEIVED